MLAPNNRKMMAQTLVIGDIHGGLKALQQVYTLAGAHKADRLVFLGDYVDGWSESAQTVEYLIRLSRAQRCIFLKGNHDEWCEAWLRTGDFDIQWLLHGGHATFKSYDGAGDNLKKSHLRFFKEMHGYFIDEQNRLFIHAGFTSNDGPQHEADVSSFSWDRTLWETALATDVRIPRDSLLFPKRLKLFEEIFLGHTPTLNFHSQIPMHAQNVWNIDTGAAFTGRLTIMDADTKKFWQSDPVHNLYPGEPGRNRAW